MERRCVWCPSRYSPAEDRDRRQSQRRFFFPRGEHMRVERGRGPYFAQVPFGLIETVSVDPRVTAYTVAVYVALGYFSDFTSGQNCRPSIRTLATKAGCSPRQAVREVRTLLELGWIELTASGKAAGKPSIYQVHRSVEGGTPTRRRGYASGAEGGTPGGRTTESQLPRAKTKTLRASPKPAEPESPKVTWLTPYYDLWLRYIGEPAVGKLAKGLKTVHHKYGQPEVARRLEIYLQATEKRFVSVQRFSETWQNWDVAPAPKPDAFPWPEGDPRWRDPQYADVALAHYTNGAQ